MVDKGLVDPAALDALIDLYENKIGPRNGAKVVARAWCDKAYKERLLSTPSEAIAELGYTGRQGEHMQVVENTDAVHNIVVCTLCSCYPWPVLGLPPVWSRMTSSNALVVQSLDSRELSLDVIVIPASPPARLQRHRGRPRAPVRQSEREDRVDRGGPVGRASFGGRRRVELR